jgi:hypothetical protein
MTPNDTRERIIARLLIRGVSDKTEAVNYLKDQVRVVDSILAELGLNGSALGDGDPEGSLQVFLNLRLKRLGQERAGLKKRSSSASLLDKDRHLTTSAHHGDPRTHKRRMSVPPNMHTTGLGGLARSPRSNVGVISPDTIATGEAARSSVQECQSRIAHIPSGKPKGSSSNSSTPL